MQLSQRKIRTSKNSFLLSSGRGDAQPPTLHNKKYSYSYYFHSDNLEQDKQPYSEKGLREDSIRLRKNSINKTESQQLGTPVAQIQPPQKEPISRHSQDRMQQFSHVANLQLDPRDQKIRLPFKSASLQSLLNSSAPTLSQQFQDDLRDWLVDLIEITTSIGFNHLNKGTLTQKETKNFVAKNILGNIKQLMESLNNIPFEHRFNTIKFLNMEAEGIFSHVARKYPQTSSKGVSSRLKSRIQVIDNREDDQFDFLFRNNIHFTWREDADYSEEIMKIINKLIAFSNEPFDDEMELQDSNYEVFSEIMELIFDTAATQKACFTAQEVLQTLASKKKKFEKDINKAFSRGNESDSQGKSFDSKRFSSRNDRVVLIGHKIPSDVPQFSEEDIQVSKFKAYDSSILRLLTKWAEQLRNKIVNAEQAIYRRRYKFKSTRGRLINLEPTLKDMLYEATVKEGEQIEEYLKFLKEENFYLQTIFTEEEVEGKYGKDGVKTRVFSAKMNEVAGQYMFKYVNRLIHALLTIPRLAAEQANSDWEKAVLQSVDLVTFKIGDMMRCKCSSSEYEFVKILNVLDYLHNHSPEVFKIVRIKNRLGTQNNDILINFFFGGKAQCQLQLSVLSAQKRNETNSGKFSHLIYEIVRAELGPLSEMATIVVQYDPLAYNYSKQDKYGPQLISKQQVPHQLKKKLMERVQFRRKVKLGSNISFPFACCTCQRLAIVHNPKMFYRDYSSPRRDCNDCLRLSYTQADCDKIKQYILQSNFAGQEYEFYKRHLKKWNANQFISELEKETDESVSSKWFPSRGLMMRMNQKSPKMQLFTSLFEQIYGYVIFAGRDAHGEVSILCGIRIHCEKQQKIKMVKKQMRQMILFQFEGVADLSENGAEFFVCQRANCCGLKVKHNPMVPRETIEDFKNVKIIQKTIKQQKNMLFLNFMPKSLDKVEGIMSEIKEKNMQWKLRKSVQAIEAYDCQLEHIQGVGMFNYLSDLNLGFNPSLVSLKGIETCTNLKYLNCNNCNLQDIDPVRKLRKLQTLNLTNNRELRSLDSLEEHCQLLDLFLKNTKVSDLAPLASCLKLQSLDLQGCSQITSIRHVQSMNLAYISISRNQVTCSRVCGHGSLRSAYSFHPFPAHHRIVYGYCQIDKQESNPVVDAVRQYALSLTAIQKQSEAPFMNEEAIQHINRILSIRRTTSAPIQPIQ